MVQRLLHHLATKHAAEDGQAAHEEADAQQVELEQAGQELRLAVDSTRAASVEQHVHQDEHGGQHRDHDEADRSRLEQPGQLHAHQHRQLQPPQPEIVCRDAQCAHDVSPSEPIR